MFRLNGSLKRARQLEAAIEKDWRKAGENYGDEDVVELISALKSLLRMMPTSLIPTELYELLTSAAG